MKIEYRTETELIGRLGGLEDNPGESITTLWLAPNVGIVKFHKEMEDMLLKVIPDNQFPFTNVITSLELKEYKTTSNISDTIINYFPIAPGSYWIYVDKDGKELTRQVVEDVVIPAQKYSSFNYNPTIENWENYFVHIQPLLYKVGETGIEFYTGDEVEKTVKTNLTKEVEIFKQFAKDLVKKRGAPQQNPIDVDHEIIVDASNHLNFLSNPVPSDNEWVASKIDGQIIIKQKSRNSPNPFSARMINFTIVESGKVIGKETIETPADIFVDCLKIEYRTNTKIRPTTLSRLMDKQIAAGESITTLWLAPDVGIVKFHRESERIFLKFEAELYKAMAELSKTGKIVQNIDLQDIDFSEFYTTTIKKFELKRYKIKPDVSQGK